MRGRSPIKAAVAATAVALITIGAAACTKEPDETGGKKGGTIRTSLGEPESILPWHSGESEGIAVVSELYTGLVDYDAKTGKLSYDDAVAEKIESADAKVWKIKLKQGWKFHDGTPVNADSFIDAWNYAAYGPNAMGNSAFYGGFKGYADLQATDPDGDGPKVAPEPKAKILSGLTKTDDYNFTVELDKPFSSFPLQVGYSGFFPMAKACLADIKACDEKPVGNGPFKLDGSWNHKVEIKMTRNDDYAGPKAKIDNLVFKIYDKITTAYADYEAGNLEVLDTVDPSKYKDAKANFSKNLRENPSSTLAYLGMPLYVKELENPKVRAALSMAIDRQAVIDAAFQGRFTPATGIVSPVIPGARTGVCEACVFNKDKAKAALAEALPGGWPAGKKLELWFNAGAGHDAWVKIIGDQIKETLGIEYVLKGDLQFAEYLKTMDEKKMTGPFRLGWSMDYPSIENYLTPIHGTGGSSNRSFYSNKEVDDLIAKANGIGNLDEAIKVYQQAEDIIVKDLPIIPIYFGRSAWLVSDKVKDITYNQVTTIDFRTAEMK